MKKRQTDQKTSQREKAGPGKNRPARGILALCLLLCLGILVSLAVLGSNIGQFSKKEAHVISLVPPEELHGKTGGTDAAASSAGKAEKQPSKKGAVSSGQTSGTTRYTAGRQAKAHGELQVFDEVQAWSSETHIDLFKNSYNDTAKSENGENIIAPGTSNFYGFTVKNNGNIPLDYTISLKVDTYLGEQETDSVIPLEWRLLTADGTAVSGWKQYNERTEVLKQAALAVRNQDSYTIEWRWDFERGETMDGEDTGMGNAAAEQPLGVNASVYLYAEQSADGNGTLLGPGGSPYTGETSHAALYMILMALSLCGLLILFMMNRCRKNDETR